MRTTRYITTTVLGISAALAGCADSATVASLAPESALGSSTLNVGVSNTATVEEFKVCKVGSSASFSYSIDLRSNGTGVDQTGTVNLTDGQCASIAQVGGLGADVTVTETAAEEGYRLDRVELTTASSPLNVCVGTPTLATTTSAGPSVSGWISGSGNDGICKGATATFYNELIPFEEGCSRTIGFWKTHAGFTGNNADVVSQHLPIWLGTAGGAKSVQVTTAAQAVSYLSMSGGASNGIVKLYAQLLAAKLNIASGASGSAIAATIATADAYLATKNAADWSSLTNQQRAQVNGWMTTFDNYNNGLIGPGHCE